jgi:hypothetical protein
MPASKNTWNKGLNSDLSKLKSQPDSYLNANNIRVITDEGNSTFAIENVKGNKFSFRLPVVEATYKIDFSEQSGDVDVTISRGTVSITFTLSNVENKNNDFLTEEINAQIQASSLPDKEYIIAYYNANFIVIYDFLPQSSNNQGITVSTLPNCSELRTSRIALHTILGWGYYNDNLVMISCFANSNSEDPQDTEGFIWDCRYDNATNEIISSQIENQNYLLPLVTLKYAGKLNLSRQYAISEHLKCRYESTEIMRLIWTDWNQNLRLCNLFDPQIWATPEELFSYIPIHLPQKPIVSQVITGGTLPTGKYQYFYQLFSNQGAESSYSPVSNLINLFPGQLSDYTVPGTNPGVNSQKSVEIFLQNLDTNYDSIRIGYVIYQIPDFPEAFFFDERPVPPTGEITLVHNGNENDIPVDSTNIANLNRPPEVFKTIDVVRNRLFAANAVTKFFDLEFDARAYRFNSTWNANLYDSTDDLINPSVRIQSNNSTGAIEAVFIEGNDVGDNLLAIEDTRDLVNPFNDENPSNPLNSTSWATFSQYKYKSDGVTLGGTGANISYEFVTQEMFARIGGTGGLVTGSPYIRPNLDFVGQYTSEFADTYSYAGGNSAALDTMKSPYLDTIFTGYARGEVYRFGIVFYDRYGYPSYTYWIGDIKFPFAFDDGFSLTNNFSDGDSGGIPGGKDVLNKQLGIRFSLDTDSPQFQSIKDQISGWSYVRVRRDLPNKTRLGTGFIQPTWIIENSLRPSESDNAYVLSPFDWAILDRKWGYDNDPISGDWRVRFQFQAFYSPDFFSRKAGSFIDGDYIRMIGRTNVFDNLSFATAIYTQQILTPSTTPDDTFLFYIAGSDFNYKYVDTTVNPNILGSSEVTSANYIATNNKYEVLNRTYVTYSTNDNYIPFGTGGLDFDFINMANANGSEANNLEFKEWGSALELLNVDLSPDTCNVFYNWGGSNLPQLKTPLYLASYERYLTVQYGGNLRSDRYANEYILTNHFMPYDKTVTGVVSNGVYGGDTWVNYYDIQRTNPNFEGEGGSGFAVGNVDALTKATGVAVFFPCESSFNTELNTSDQHASVRTTSNSIFPSRYSYNDALSQENTTNIFISKAFNQTNVKYEPHTIYGTEPKLDNERLDSWRKFLINNSLTVNGNYGEINRIIQFKDKLFYYQNDGFGVASVDERVLANEGDSTQTQLGTGTLLQRFDYISTETGVKHSFAVRSTGSSIYHYDAFINKLFRYSMGSDGAGVSPLTDIKGLSGFFRTAFVDTNLKSEDKILRTGADGRVGISSGYNSEYNTVYFTFFCKTTDDVNVKYTISYNELLDSFESFYDFYPSMYLNMRKRFLSIDPANTGETYVHNIGKRNTFYNIYYPSSVTFRVNENSDFVKTFDNFMINTEVILNNIQLAETITQLGIVNDYQIVNQQNANFTQKIRSWRKQIPRDETNLLLNIKPRIADKYIDVTFTHDPLNLDKTFRLHDVITEYSMRSKILPR